VIYANPGERISNRYFEMVSKASNVFITNAEGKKELFTVLGTVRYNTGTPLAVAVSQDPTAIFVTVSMEDQDIFRPFYSIGWPLTESQNQRVMVVSAKMSAVSGNATAPCGVILTEPKPASPTNAYPHLKVSSLERELKNRMLTIEWLGDVEIVPDDEQGL
jgi:hypothetical protein